MVRVYTQGMKTTKPATIDPELLADHKRYQARSARTIKEGQISAALDHLRLPQRYAVGGELRTALVESLAKKLSLADIEQLDALLASSLMRF